MNGAALIIGSLLWETESNSLEKGLGKSRELWRENLCIDQKYPVKVPIRYGRISLKRRSTYTMVFSNSVCKLGSAFLIPYDFKKSEGSDLKIFKDQAFDLSFAEGISKTSQQEVIIGSWGCVGVYFNPNTKNDIRELQEYWENLFANFNNDKYKIETELPSITKKGELNFKIDIHNDIDYVFAVSTVPNVHKYPNKNEIVDAILKSSPRYDTYMIQNLKNGIRVHEDEEMLSILTKQP